MLKELKIRVFYIHNPLKKQADAFVAGVYNQEI